jgi:hypothetical protein
MGSVYSHSASARGRIESGSELLASITLDNTDVVGSVVLDMLINPSYLGGTRLAAQAATYSLFRFTKFNIRICTKMPSVAMGGIMFAITRDVDNDLTDAISYCASAESSIDMPIWESGELRAQCSTLYNRQKYFDTSLKSEIDEAFQFRLIGVVTQAFGLVGTLTGTPTMALQLYVDYDVEFVGDVAPQGGYGLAGTLNLGNTYTVTSGGEITTGAGVTLPSVANTVYFFNPALSEAAIQNGTSLRMPIRAAYSTGSKLLAFDTPAAAIINPHFPNINGDAVSHPSSSAIRVYSIGHSSAPPIVGLSTLPQITRQIATSAELVQRHDAENKEQDAKITEADKKQQQFNADMRRIVARSEAMQSAITTLLGGLGKLVLGDSNTGFKDTLKATSSVLAIGAPDL